MRAIVTTGPGGPEVLVEREVPFPEPGPGEMRVRVHAFGLNRADLLQRRGLYPAPPGVPADVPGLEYAGEVDALGPDVMDWRPGDRVMGLVGGGGYAEAVVTASAEALPVPVSFSWEEAASVPEAFMTAHDAIFTLLGARGGQTLLVHAVGSGVGTAAVQLARAAGLRVIGTGRSAWKLERAAALGLDLAIDVSEENFADAVLRHTEGRGVDLVLDLVGARYLADNLRSLKSLGRMAVVGLVAGARAELDLGLLLRKRLTVVGTTLRSRGAAEKAAVTAAFRRDVLPLLESGAVRPILDTVLPASEIQAAHRRMDENANFGKVVVRGWGR